MAIDVQHLNCFYMQGGPFESHALNDISFSVSDGEFIGVIGHTGSGKSTLMQHLNGLMKPQSGKVLVDGVSTDTKNGLKEIRCKVGLVFQYPEHQLFEETVFKDIAFGPQNLGLNGDELKKRVFQAMEYVGLPESLADVSPFALSGGQKRRVAIAGVLAMGPKVLVLDEPTAGLDPVGKNEILAQIRSVFQKTNMTVIFVSHTMEDVAMLATRLIVMHRGKIALDGTPNDVFSQGNALRSMGLDVPEVCKVMQFLNERRIHVKSNIYTLEDAIDEILSYIKKIKEKR